MSFGFSASDFVTFGKLIFDVTTALQDAGGAKSEYQDLVRELESLNTVLRHLDKLDCDTQTASQTVLSIKYTALSCRHPLEVFLAKIQKYQQSLGVWSRSSTIRTATDKLGWSFRHGDEARRLQVFLNVHISTLNILLAEHGFERMDLSDKKSDAHAQAAHDQLEKTNAAISQIGKDFKGQALMVRSVQSMLSSLYTLVCGDMKTSLQHFSHVVNGVCVRTQQIYNVVLQVRDSLATLDTRWTHFQECIRVEDALGISFTVPSECDYSMLITFIHRRFDSGPGAADVYAGNYELYVTNKRSELVTAHTKLAPGVAITMAIIISTDRNFETRCPMTRCGSLKVAACPGGVMLCKDCGVKFDRATKKRRRFEELGDEDLNIAGSAASHCTTCTCCRPSKRLKMKSMDVKEQRALFRNVRWALDEDGQPAPARKSLVIAFHINGLSRFEKS